MPNCLKRGVAMAKRRRGTQSVGNEYQKYYKALKVLSRYDEQIPEPTEAKRATKKITSKTKREYYKARKILNEQGVVDLPNVNVLSSYFDERQSLPPKEPIDTGEDLIEGFKAHLQSIYDEWNVSKETKNYNEYFKNNIEPKFYEAMTKLDAIVDIAGSNEKAADYIKSQPDYDAVLGTDYFALLYDLNEYFIMTLEFMDSVMTDILIDIS